MGSAAAWALAGRGAQVDVFEQQGATQRRGSSHGETRGIRLAYEDPEYASWAEEALRAWRAFEVECGEDLVTMTGGLDVGVPDAASFQATVATLHSLGLAYEELSALEVGKRWPGMTLPLSWYAVYQPDAGLIAADRALAAFRRRAEAGGATFHVHTAVRALGDLNAEAGYDGLVCAAGPWTATVPGVRELWGDAGNLRALACEPLTVGLADGPAHMPLYFVHPGGEWSDGVYVQPQASGPGGEARIKVGRHGGLAVSSPDALAHDAVIEDHAALVARAATVVPALEQSQRTISSERCFYTMTPDERFHISAVPGAPTPTVIAAGFSGHGFKFAPVVGLRIADLVASSLVI